MPSLNTRSGSNFYFPAGTFRVGNVSIHYSSKIAIILSVFALAFMWHHHQSTKTEIDRLAQKDRAVQTEVAPSPASSVNQKLGAHAKTQSAVLVQAKTPVVHQNDSKITTKDESRANINNTGVINGDVTTSTSESKVNRSISIDNSINIKTGDHSTVTITDDKKIETVGVDRHTAKQ